MERLTGVHVDYFHPSALEVDTQFQLMIASDDFADLIYHAEKYVGGGDNAIADGVYIRLNELIDEHAPNYKAAREYYDEQRKWTISSQGNLWGFYALCLEREPGYQGLDVRLDMLEELNMDRPKTLSDWENMLDAFKNQLGLKYGVVIPPTGLTQHSAFASAWDVGVGFYQVDGVVKYGPIEEDFYNYIELMNDWYNKGYLDPEFFAADSSAQMGYTGHAIREMGEGKAGSADGANIFGKMAYDFGMSEDENIFIASALNPVLNEGDDMHFRMVTLPVKQEVLAVSSQASDPELCVKWIDARYTKQFISLLTYGVEGITHVKNDDDSITFLKTLTENEKMLAPNMALYGIFSPGLPAATIFDWTNGFAFLGKDYTDNLTYWLQDGADYVLPEIDLLTNEHATEFANLYSEIETYVHETVPKLISGSIPLSDYGKFVDQLKRMNIERCIELKQLTLDDYNNR